MPGGEEEQEIENLFENIMENFPNLAKEIDFQEVQGPKRIPKKLDPRKHTPRHIISTLPKMKEEKTQSPTKELPSDCQLISHKKPYRQGAGKKYLKS